MTALPTEVEWCLAYDLAMSIAGREPPVSQEVVHGLWKKLPADERMSIYTSCCEIAKAGPMKVPK